MARESPGLHAVVERHTMPPAADTERVFSNPLAETFSFQTWHTSDAYEPSTSDFTSSAAVSRQPSHTLPPERQRSNLAQHSMWAERIKEAPLLRQVCYAYQHGGCSLGGP